MSEISFKCKILRQLGLVTTAYLKFSPNTQGKKISLLDKTAKFWSVIRFSYGTLCKPVITKFISLSRISCCSQTQICVNAFSFIWNELSKLIISQVYHTVRLAHNSPENNRGCDTPKTSLLFQTTEFNARTELNGSSLGKNRLATRESKSAVAPT